MSQDMGGFAVVGGATGPADMGGFSPVPVKPSADMGGFTLVGGARQQPPTKPAAAYPSKQDFSSIADKAFGPGKWTPTSEFRTKAHNAQVGGVPHSNHMKGTPDNPGAYDIVVPGMNAAQIGAALKKAGWTGTDYPEKDHLHTNAPAVKPARFQDPRRPEVKPAPGDIARETAPGRQALGKDLGRFLTPGQDEDRLATAARAAYDVADVGFSALSGAAQEGLRHVPGFKGNTEERQKRRQQYGDLASMLAPIPGAEEARVARMAVGKVVKPVAGAVVDGFKVLTRDPATDERAAKAVRNMTGRKPATTAPGKPYVAGTYEGQYIYAKPAGSPTDAHTNALFEALDAEIKRLAPAAKNRPLHEPVGGMLGFHTRDASDKSVISWALNRDHMEEEYRDQAKTVRHEAIHALRDDGFFHPTEWAALEKQAKAENWMERYNIHGRYPGQSEARKLEEAIADGFADWRRKRDAAVRMKGLSAHVTRAFQRLDDLLTAVKGHARRLFGQDVTAEHLFGQIDRGKVGRRDISGLSEHDLYARRNPDRRPGYKPDMAPQSGPGDMGGFKPVQESKDTLPPRHQQVYQGVRKSAAGGPVVSEYWTEDLGLAKAYASREGSGGAIRIADARSFPGGSLVALDRSEPGKPGKVIQIPHTLVPLDEVDARLGDEPQSGPADMGGFEPAIQPSSGSSRHPTDNVIGTEKDPVERVDNALFRLGNHDTASKIEAKQFLDDVPDAIKDPKVQERLTHALEERLKDPNAPIPPDLQDAYDAYKPWAERQRAAINEKIALKRKAGMALDPEEEEEAERYAADVGYVPRYRKGYSPGFDEKGLNLPGDKQRSTLGGGKSSLRTKSKSEMQRQFHVVTDADGRESFVEGPVASEDPTGRPYAKVRQAKIAEIEKATGGEVEYHKNALVNTMVRALDDEKTLRNLKVLEELKSTLKSKGLAYQHQWHDADNVRRTHPEGMAGIPEGFVDMKHIPQLEGWYMDPKVADAFRDYHPLPGEPEADVIQKINRLATASMFITPFPHSINIGAMWTIGRGWDWMNPGAYPRMMKAGAQALNEVLTLGPRYRQMLREGSALRAVDDATRNFHEAMLKAAGHQIETNPRTFRALAKAFGTGSMTPKDVVATIYAASHRMVWTVNDLALLQRQFELEARGMTTRDAIKEAETWIANYRVPPQVMKSRSMNRLLTSNHAIVFGRYEYGKWRALGEMAKPFLGKATGAERLDRLGKILVLGILLAGVHPLMDRMLKKATGNDDAEFRSGGEASVVDAATDLGKTAASRLFPDADITPGEKSFAEDMGSMLSLSPWMQTPAEVLNNRYSFTGQPIIEPDASPAGAAAEAIEGTSQYVLPLSSGLQALQPGGLEQSLGALAGIKLPAKDKETGIRKRDKFQKAQAKRRERRDPLTQDLKDMMP